MSGAPPEPWRLAAHTYAYRDEPLDAALERISRLGFSAVEVWIGHAGRGPASVVQSLTSANLQAVAVGAGGFYEDSTAVDSSAFRAFELAQAVGAERVVACVSPRALPRLARSVPAGLTLCIENHWDQAVRRPGDVLSLVERAPAAPLAACLDTGHALLTGIAPDRFALRLGSRLAHIHLKDARRPSAIDGALPIRLRKRLRPRPLPVAAGAGDLDVARLLGALDRLGYRGWITVEDEGAGATSALAGLRAAVLSIPAPSAAQLQS